MFNVMQPWGGGDVLIQLGIFFGGTYIIFLFKRYVFPWLSEHRARLSSSYRRKQFVAWTNALEQFELDLADGRRFTTRLIHHAFLATILLLITATSVVSYQMNDLVYKLSCDVLNRCLRFTPNDSLLAMKIYSFAWFVIGFVSLYGLFTYLAKVHDDVNPEKYRKFLKERIAR
jgi:hypothetical protein